MSIGLYMSLFGISFNVNLLKGIIYKMSALKCLKTTGLVCFQRNNNNSNFNEAIWVFPLPFEHESAKLSWVDFLSSLSHILTKHF